MENIIYSLMPFFKKLCISLFQQFFLNSPISIVQEKESTATALKVADQYINQSNYKDTMYMQGDIKEVDIAKGSKQDYRQAAKNYLNAANRGDIEAMFTVGYFYSKGLGVKQDMQQAKLWYQNSKMQEKPNNNDIPLQATFKSVFLYRYTHVVPMR